MVVRYTQPLSDAFSRTRTLLFSAFEFGRWFVLGFTAWLIHLGSMGGSAAGNDPDVQARIRTGDWEGAIDALGDVFAEIMPGGLAAALVLSLVALAVLVGLVLLWLGCRARFIWLENLTAGDHRFGDHWTRHGHLGDSFFLWKIGFAIAVLAVIVPMLLFSGVIGIATGEAIGGPATAFGWIGLGIATFVVVVLASFVDFYAEAYVTVIMHRRNVGVLAAWREFRRYFEAAPGHFVLVGLVKLSLHILAAALILAFGLVTCCVGWLLVSLPYIGAVIQLPIYAVLRYFDLCWFGQFDPTLGAGPTPRLSAGESTPDSDPTP